VDGVLESRCHYHVHWGRLRVSGSKWGGEGMVADRKGLDLTLRLNQNHSILHNKVGLVGPKGGKAAVAESFARAETAANCYRSSMFT